MTNENTNGSQAPVLSIIVPVFNERGAVRGVIEGIRGSGTVTPHEIVVVDDASNDGTADVLAELEKQDIIRVVRHEANKGYGAALKSGTHAARGELVMIIDGDGSYPVKHFDEFVARAGSCDMVVGARVGAVLEEPKIRTWVKAFIIFMLKLLADVDVPDLNSGLRLMKREQVTRYFALLPDGISFTSTITLILLSEGRSVSFIPIDYFARHGASKFKPVRDTMGILILILRTFLYFNPLKVFLPAAAGLFALAAAVGMITTLAGKFMDVTTVVIALAAVQVLVLGLIADLVAKRRA